MDEYLKEFTKFVEAAVDKAKELGGTAKIHALIKAEEAKKQEQYYRLSKKYYQLFKDTPEKDLALYVDKLKASDEKIEALREELKSSGEGDEYRDVEEEQETASEAEEGKE